MPIDTTGSSGSVIHRTGLRTRMISAFLPLVLAMAATGVFSYRMSRIIFVGTDSLFAESLMLRNLIHSVDTVALSLEGYLSTKHFDHLNRFLQEGTSLRLALGGLARERSRDPGELMLRNIAAMIGSYLDEADAAMDARRRRDIALYIEHYSNAERIVGYIEIATDRYNRWLLDARTARYARLSRVLRQGQIFGLAVMVLVSSLSLGVLVSLTFRVTDPIIRLAAAAERVSQGDFDSPVPEASTGDELESLGLAFGRMVRSLRKYIAELRDQATLRERLREEEVRNLGMKHALKEAELAALQSRVNPHFLFNTLNAGVQLAMFEGADRTGRFMGELSSLLRYNLRHLDQPVSLADEFGICRIYVSLLGIRFGDRIRYEERLEEACLGLAVPCMILQPLVENAFIHGLEPKPAGGTISVSASRAGPDEDRYVLVRVSDDGVGMDADTLERLRRWDDTPADQPGGSPLPGSPAPGASRGHTTGIGLGNVRDRLRHHYGRDDVLRVESGPGGTAVTIMFHERRPADAEQIAGL